MRSQQEHQFGDIRDTYWMVDPEKFAKAWEEEFAAKYPNLLTALRIDGLSREQKAALYAALAQLDLVGINPTQAFVNDAGPLDNPALINEFFALRQHKLFCVELQIAPIKGTRRERDAVRARVCLALRLARLAAVN